MCADGLISDVVNARRLSPFRPLALWPFSIGYPLAQLSPCHVSAMLVNIYMIADLVALVCETGKVDVIALAEP